MTTSPSTNRNNRIPEAINIYWGKYSDGRPNILAFYVNGKATRGVVSQLLAKSDAPRNHLPHACRNQKLATSHMATLQYVLENVAYKRTRSNNGKFYQYVIDSEVLAQCANADSTVADKPLTQVSEPMISTMPNAPLSVSDWECPDCLAHPKCECDACAQFRVAASAGKLSYDEGVVADLNINQDERELAYA